MLNVYGEPDELLEFKDEDGQQWIVIVDFKTSSKNPKYGENDEYNPNKINKQGIPAHFHQGFGPWHRVQLNFMHGFLKKLSRETSCFPIWSSHNFQCDLIKMTFSIMVIVELRCDTLQCICTFRLELD